MKKLLLIASSALAFLLPSTAQAKDASPAKKQVYKFKPTGKTIRAGKKPSAGSKNAYIKFDGIDGEVTEKEERKSGSGVLWKVEEGESVNERDCKVYRATNRCKK